MNSLRFTLVASTLTLAACSPKSTSGNISYNDASPSDGVSSDVVTVDTAPPTDSPAPPDVTTDAPAPQDVVTPIDAPTDTPPPLDAPDDVVIDVSVDAVTDVSVDAVTDAPVDVPTDARPSCRSDRECAATSQVCDLSQSRCVDCVRDADCLTPGTRCLSNRCVTPVMCTSSRMCPGQVCDTTRSLCVDCVADVDCATTEMCRASACVPRPPTCASDSECAAPTPRCNPTSHACVACNVNADCGASRACTADHVCVSTACTPGATDCFDSRTRRVCAADGMSSMNTPCPDVTGGTGACAAGACTITCAAGLANCDGMAANGCETSLNTDALNCGACGNRCASVGDGAASVCTAGRCSLACATGRGDCDGVASNGCETDLLTSNGNCGRCGNTCSTGACSAGACPRILRTFTGPNGIGTDCLHPNDDGSWAGPPPTAGTPAVPISLTYAFPMGLQYFGANYGAMYVNNNGNITFRGALGTFTPAPFPVAMQPMIAPWWGDVDTRGGGQPMRNNVCFVVQPSRVIVTWDRVGYFSSHDDRQNTFQLLLSTRAGLAAGDFDVEFRYERCEWTTGDASGGTGGFGGTPAQVGFDAGDMHTFYSLPMSRTMAILDVCTSSNVGTPGIWRFQVRGGVITPGL